MGSAMRYTDSSGVDRVRDINAKAVNAQGVDIMRERSDLELAQFTEADEGAMFNAAESLGLAGGSGVYFYDGTAFIKLTSAEMDEVTATAGAALITVANRSELLACSLIPITSATDVSPGTAATTPILPDGYPGQEVTLLNSGSKVITLTDQITMAASNLRLQANLVALQPLNSIKLVYSNTVGDWIQQGPIVDTITPFVSARQPLVASLAFTSIAPGGMDFGQVSVVGSAIITGETSDVVESTILTVTEGTLDVTGVLAAVTVP